MRTVILIPARYASSRFPGKPLVKLLGKPMILWVAELAAQALPKNDVYVATDDETIQSVVTKAGFNVVMTSADCLTGTDRLAEAASKIEADIFVNVQGDEPLASPQDIKRIIEFKQQNPQGVVNGYCYLGEGEVVDNINIPKVITNESGRLVYMSRAGLPGFKDIKNRPERYKKQVCIYAFNKSELQAFAAFGRKSELEKSEDIEILRFLELGIHINMLETAPGSLAVDVQEDIGPVELALKRTVK